LIEDVITIYTKTSKSVKWKNTSLNQ